MNALDRFFEKENNPETIRLKEAIVSKIREIINIYLDKAQEWLQPYVDKSLLSYERLNGWPFDFDKTGKFSVEYIKITYQKQEVYISPQSQTVIAGALCRIDMWSNKKRFIFLYVDKKNNGNNPMDDMQQLPYIDSNDFEWKMLADRISIEFLQLNKDIFYEALVNLLDGNSK